MDDPSRRGGVREPAANGDRSNGRLEGVWEAAAGRVGEGALLEVRQGML